MNIGIVGLGLIGASMAKAIKKYTENKVFGYDINEEVAKKAYAEGAIDKMGNEEDMPALDMLFLALYPKTSIEFVKKSADRITKNCIVCDFGGVKKVVCEELGKTAAEKGFHFVGGHPMAGRELSGYDASLGNLLEGASMNLTPDEKEKESAEKLAEFFKGLGFSKVVFTTPENHDDMIAFTSQLAHVVSSAYIKSPEASRHEGYSAGSYRDLTRVARLNECMWTELFLENREPLVREIDTIIAHLREYRDAIKNGAEEELFNLLKEGRERKEQIDREIE